MMNSCSFVEDVLFIFHLFPIDVLIEFNINSVMLPIRFEFLVFVRKSIFWFPSKISQNRVTFSFNNFIRKIIEKSAWGITLLFTPEHAMVCKEDTEMRFCACHADVHQTTFFFQLLAIKHAGTMWENSFLASGNNDVLEFQALA